MAAHNKSEVYYGFAFVVGDAWRYQNFQIETYVYLDKSFSYLDFVLNKPNKTLDLDSEDISIVFANDPVIRSFLHQNDFVGETCEIYTLFPESPTLTTFAERSLVSHFSFTNNTITMVLASPVSSVKSSFPSKVFDNMLFPELIINSR